MAAPRVKLQGAKHQALHAEEEDPSDLTSTPENMMATFEGTQMIPRTEA